MLTAIEGEWVEAPGYKLFDRLLPEIPGIEIVAEDLGMMRDEVYMLRDHYDFPGMNVLQFTLLDEKFKWKKNMIVYTGTHDNDTVEGWWAGLSEDEQNRLNEELKRRKVNYHVGTKAEQFVRLAFSLDTETAIVPVWDLLSYPTEKRINLPGVIQPSNWTAKERNFKKLYRRKVFLSGIIRKTKR